jgi:hypothetical protein
MGGGNSSRQGGFQPRFADGNNNFNGSNNGGSNNPFFGQGDRNIDDAFLQKTVAAVVAAVSAANKPAAPVDLSKVGDAASGAGVPAVAASQVGTSGTAAPSGAQADAPAQASLTEAAASKPKEAEGLGFAKKKRTDKNTCFRCKKPNHHIDDCTTPFCAYCESIHHLSAACPLLLAPKPTVILHGYANEHLMFFELPCVGSSRRKRRILDLLS